MQLSATSLYTLHAPTRCERRVFLRARHEKEGEPSPFDQLIEELGRRHEREHLSQFDGALDLRDGGFEERIHRTREAIEAGEKVIYQGVLRSKLPGKEVDVVGIPDFLIRSGSTFAIRECKLSRRVAEDHHPEILRQLELYGWLFDQTAKRQPARLEVYLGDQSLFQWSYDGGGKVLEELEFIRSLSVQTHEPDSPVGWSKCGGCGFHDRCWKIAEEKQDVALVIGIDQGAAAQLHSDGVFSIPQLLASHTKTTLEEFKRPHGTRMQKVGTRAERILLQAEAMLSDSERLIAPLELPTQDNLVMFDLEGLPPMFDELDKVYLWGMQVFGKEPGKYLPAVASFGAEGDREGWERFLENSHTIIERYGDIPFIHWASYEITKLRLYIDRFGDIGGIAGRVLENCVDLLPVTQRALVLPEYSYGLKVVEKRAGFKRTMEEYGGNWSIVQYIKAVETEDEILREKTMDAILRYNEEDLQATWAVFQWLKTMQ